MRRQVILIILLALCAGLTIWVTSMDKIGFMTPFTYGQMRVEAQRHLWMVFWGVLIAIAIGVPLGILVTRPGFRKLATPVISIANVGQG